MKTKVVAVAAILLGSTLWLAGCTYVGLGGGPPCSGFGCRAGLLAPTGKSQSATQQGDGKNTDYQATRLAELQAGQLTSPSHRFPGTQAGTRVPFFS